MNYLVALLSLLEGQSLDLVLYDFREDRDHLFGDIGSTVDALQHCFFQDSGHSRLVLGAVLVEGRLFPEVLHVEVKTIK